VSVAADEEKPKILIHQSKLRSGNTYAGKQNPRGKI
jgi:hypothetical protein